MISHAPIIFQESVQNNKKHVWRAARTRPFSRQRRRRTGDFSHQQICFTKGPRFWQSLAVGKTLATCVSVLVALSCVQAQEQESKLVDRLLRPEMALANSAQNKKFNADRVPINKQAAVGTFYIQEKSNSKTFSGTRDFSARQFSSQSFHGSRSASGISSQQQAIGTSRPAYPAQTARGVRDAPQSDTKVATRSYAGNRPFLDQGKSQKSLNRQNAPMTIEQVRELLNKNK
jgi:hypothetical protein